MRTSLIAISFCLGLLSAGGQPAQAAFNVTQTSDTLNVTGPIANNGDWIVLMGAGPAAVHVWDTGVYLGLFNSVAHVDVDIWGVKKASVRLLFVQIKGDATVTTGNGSDSVLLVSNEIGGAVNIGTAKGDDSLDTQHNTFYGDFNAGAGTGADWIGLYDNGIYKNATINAGSGDNEIRVGYDHAHPVYPANAIDGDLVVSADDGYDSLEVALNAVGGHTILNTGLGWSDVLIRQNEVRQDLTLTTGDGIDYVQVRSNTVTGDAQISLGAAAHQKYLFVEDENLVKGDLLIKVGPCAGSIVDVIQNDVRRNTNVALDTSSFPSDVTVESNLLHGNVALSTVDAGLMYLDSNWIRGALDVGTGNDWDEVSLFLNTCESDVTIDVGGGDDVLWLGDPVFNPGGYPNTFSANLSVGGGAGFDQLYHEPLNTYALPPTAQGFESVFP